MVPDGHLTPGSSPFTFESSMKHEGKLTPKGAKRVAALERFRDTIAAGIPIEQRYSVRRVKLNLTPQAFGPE